MQRLKRDSGSVQTSITASSEPHAAVLEGWHHPTPGQISSKRRQERALKFVQRRTLLLVLIVGLVTVTLILAGGRVLYSKKVHALTEKDTIVAADFENKTGDTVFDDTLRQALTIDLEQSPYLNIFPDVKIQDTLKLMGQSTEKRITGEIAREVCVRNGLKAFLTGSVANLGSQYIVTLKAVNAATGDLVAHSQAQADSKERVLKALGDAALELRQKLGESLRSVQQFDTPIQQATTPSLDALKAYSLGYTFFFRGDRRGAIPFFEQAIELDPNFAMAYARLGTSYLDTGEPDRALTYHKKAFELSNHVTQAERFYILDLYYFNVTGI